MARTRVQGFRGPVSNVVTQAIERSLANIQILDGLGAAERATLEAACQWRQYAEQQQIIDQRSDSRDVFFVSKGRVRVVIYSVGGREIIFDDIGPGGVFGELAAIDGDPRSANVIALEDTVVAVLPQRAFVELLQRNSDVSFTIMKRLVQVIRGSDDRIIDLSTLGAHNRVMAELLREARSGAGKEGPAVISPLPPHTDIASRASTTRETVSRVLSELTQNGVIERERDTLTILDIDRLEAMVQDFKAV